MVEKWNDYDLPQCVIINENEYSFSSDYKTILEVMKLLNDKTLLDEEKIYCACYLFYDDWDDVLFEDSTELIESMMLFISGNRTENDNKKHKPLMDWEKDLPLIISPINRVVGHDIRLDNLHWWTFLSYFMEIGECTFNTYVGIRDKKNKGKKLEKYEEEIFKNNMKAIKLEQEYDEKTQSALDEIREMLRKR